MEDPKGAAPVMVAVRRRIPDGPEGLRWEVGDVSVRLAQPEDLETVCAIEAQSFSNPWQPDTFRSLLRRDRVRIFVAELPGEGVVGYAVMWWVLEEGELANLAVSESHQGRGIGSSLLDHVLAHAKTESVESLFLEVRASNRRAQRLYLARSFCQVGVRRGYYQNPREDALVLVRRVQE